MSGDTEIELTEPTKADPLNRIQGLSRLLRQCSVALASPSGDDEDVTVIAAAMDAPLEDIPGLVSDRVSDLECDVAQARARVAELEAENAKLRAVSHGPWYINAPTGTSS